ncbi:MAG TPA: GNAT family protein [Terriglobales bacterium]
MALDETVLTGRYVRLEPLEMRHAAALARASSEGDAELYRWSPVPRTEAEAEKYIQTALTWRDAGTAVSFATVRLADDRVVGSTRFFLLEYWAWPEGHELHGRKAPDACEIGYTWLAPSATRTPINTEAKFLMLQYAFEQWNVFRVCLHTDMRNVRSRAAIERIGGKFEGTLRAHRMASDFIARDSARFSIVASEWPEVKERLRAKLNRAPNS